MTEAILRPVRRSDAPALAALWNRVFGDPEELALSFLALLPELGGGVTAEEGDALLGAAYIVTDLTLEDRRAAYLYAVGVLPEARGRGLGKELTRAAAALGRELGADFVCTLPASAGLYPWYERLIGTRCALYRREERFSSAPGPAVRPLAPEDYGRRREELLAGQCHMRPGLSVLRYEKANCRAFGGDLLAVGEGIAAAYRDGEETLIRELLAPAGADRETLAAAVGACLGTGQVLLLSSAPEGTPYLAADRPLPADCVWNLSLD